MDLPSDRATPKVALVVAAAGSGERLGFPLPKALVPLAGRPLVAHTLELASSLEHLALVSIAAPSGHVDDVERIAETVAPPLTVRVVVGGSTRQASVRMALEAVPPDVDVVLCHDAARPFASRELVQRLLGALIGTGPDIAGAVPVVPPVDTVKRIARGEVVETMPRETVALAQTPQAFRARPLREAHAAADDALEATDDAMLVERAGGRVITVPGDPANFKVTTPDDLDRADRLASAVDA